MEKVFYKRSHVAVLPPLDLLSSDWRAGLPTLSHGRATVREVRMSDAESLSVVLNTEEVARFISPPSSTFDACQRFIAWSGHQRAAGRSACFAVVPSGMDAAVGIIHVRELEPGFGTAEWGFAIGSEFWGTGLFQESAQLVMDFTFATLGSHRLEARSATANGRGNGALRKMGATLEGVLRRSFLKNGQYVDQNLWCILDADWLEKRWGQNRGARGEG